MGSSSPGSPGVPVPSCAIASPFWVGKATAKNNKRHKTRARRLPRFTPGGFGAKQKRNGNRNRGAGPRGGAAAAGARPAPPPAPGGIFGEGARVLAPPLARQSRQEPGAALGQSQEPPLQPPGHILAPLGSETPGGSSRAAGPEGGIGQPLVRARRAARKALSPFYGAKGSPGRAGRGHHRLLSLCRGQKNSQEESLMPSRAGMLLGRGARWCHHRCAAPWLHTHPSCCQQGAAPRALPSLGARH